MTDNCSFLDKDTSFQGEICTRDIVIEGAVSGEVEATDTVLIRNGAVIDGPIRTGRILLEEGGRHSGRLNFRPAAESSDLLSFFSRLFGNGKPGRVPARPPSAATSVAPAAADARSGPTGEPPASVPPSGPPASASSPSDSLEKESEKAGVRPGPASGGKPEKKKSDSPQPDSWSEQLW